MAPSSAARAKRTSTGVPAIASPVAAIQRSTVMVAHASGRDVGLGERHAEDVAGRAALPLDLGRRDVLRHDRAVERVEHTRLAGRVYDEVGEQRRGGGGRAREDSLLLQTHDHRRLAAHTVHVGDHAPGPAHAAVGHEGAPADVAQHGWIDADHGRRRRARGAITIGGPDDEGLTHRRAIGGHEHRRGRRDRDGHDGVHTAVRGAAVHGLTSVRGTAVHELTGVLGGRAPVVGGRGCVVGRRAGVVGGCIRVGPRRGIGAAGVRPWIGLTHALGAHGGRDTLRVALPGATGLEDQRAQGQQTERGEFSTSPHVAGL